MGSDDYSDKAKQRIDSANHMLTVSYPLVEDPKILLSVAKNLLKAAEFSIEGALHKADNVSNYKDSVDSKYNAFIQNVVPKYDIDKKHIETITNLKEIVQTHEDSSVEFKRDKKFVMADETYELRTLSKKDLQQYLRKTRNLIKEVEAKIHGGTH